MNHTKDIEEIKRIHASVIKTMNNMGYGLLLDGKTFYKIGYEIEPRKHPTFTMTQAYEIYSLSEQLLIKAKIDELERYRTAHAKHHDEEYCLDNFHNFTYVTDRIAELEKELRDEQN